MTEYIKRTDAIHAALHNEGAAAVAAIQGLKAFSPHDVIREMLIDEMIDRANRSQSNAELIKAIRENEECNNCAFWLHGECNERKMSLDAADALEAQMPKEGYWIPNSPFTGNCSECGGNGNLKDNYCPNCGAKMKGEHDED